VTSFEGLNAPLLEELKVSHTKIESFAGLPFSKNEFYLILFESTVVDLKSLEAISQEMSPFDPEFPAKMLACDAKLAIDAKKQDLSLNVASVHSGDNSKEAAVLCNAIEKVACKGFMQPAVLTERYGATNSGEFAFKGMDWSESANMCHVNFGRTILQRMEKTFDYLRENGRHEDTLMSVEWAEFKGLFNLISDAIELCAKEDG
jgi:hypothetical protein